MIPLKSPILFWAIGLLYAPFSYSQKVFEDVVKITVSDKSNPFKQVGSGIVVGRLGEEVYLVTARHVLDESGTGELASKEITVNFYKGGGKSYYARAHPYFNANLDLAVVTVTVPFENKIFFPQWKLGNLDYLKEGTKIKQIGHPNNTGWVLNKDNSLQNKGFGLSEFTTTSIGITSGYSGGPLLDKQNRLLGIITQVSANQALIIKMETIINELNNARLPTSLIDPFKAPPIIRLGWTIGLSTAGLGSFIGGFIFNENGEDTYQPYKESWDPTAPVYNELGIDRPDVLRDAQDDYKLRDYAYSLGSAFLISAVLVNVINRPEKGFAKNIEFYPVLEQVFLQQKGLQVGITIKL